MSLENQYSDDMTPQSVPLDVSFDGEQLVAERYGAVADGQGWESPEGITVIGGNGNSVKAKDWERMRRLLVAGGLRRNLDVTFVSLDDGEYYDQESFTGAVVATAQAVRDEVPESHAVWFGGWSRGGISVTHAAGHVGRLAETGAVQGLMTMGAPAVAMNTLQDAPAVRRRTAIPNPLRLLTSPLEVADETLTQVEESQLAGRIMLRAVARHANKPEEVEAEAEEIKSISIAGELAELSHRSDFDVVTAFYDSDRIVPSGPHIAELEAAGFGGRILRLPGTHFRPTVDATTQEKLLDQIDDAKAA